MPTVTLTIADTSPWEAPPGIYDLIVECFGAGGGGGGCYSTDAKGAGGGGGGGAYSKKTIASPNGFYAYSVGAKGVGRVNNSGTAGGATWFLANSSSGCVAKGGGAGGIGTNTACGAAGAGGDATTGYGITKYSGGAGYSFGASIDTEGGGGGEGAGTASNGTAASSATGASGVADGGDGGNGGAAHTTGNNAAPGEYGGGGGGAGHRGGTNLAGGDGTNGKIVLTWSETPNIYVPKANVYSVLGPPKGISTTKANVYSVLGLPKGVSVSKAVVYSVLGPPMVYTGKGSIYLAGEATCSFRPAYIASGACWTVGEAATSAFTIAVLYEYVASGSFTFDGSAVLAREFEHPISGGVIIEGLATYNLSPRCYAASGSFAIAGKARIRRNFYPHRITDFGVKYRSINCSDLLFGNKRFVRTWDGKGPKIKLIR